MNYAAIDIGTNSIRLLIAEYKDGQLNRLVNELRTPRLGDGINNGEINSKAQARAIKVLQEYKRLIDKYEASYRAVATSAIRDAANQEEFLNKVKKKAQIKIDVIEGSEEAKLSYLGIINGIKKNRKNMLAIDIGGGSTELILGSKDELTEYKSINLGAVRLKENYQQDIKAMQEYAKQIISKTAVDKNIEMLIGVGGTITTLAAIDQELENYQPEKIQNHKLSLTTVNNIFSYLMGLSLEERKKVTGLEKNRADIIIPGILILIAIMEFFSIKQLRVSDFGILEGIIYNNSSNGLK